MGNFRHDWWEPLKCNLLGYPKGHRLYTPNVFIRYYPLAITLMFGVPLLYAVARWLLDH